MANVRDDKVVYPYIPNSAPGPQREMMEFVGVENLWDLYEEIPENLRYKENLDIPPAILDEFSIQKHVKEVLSRNIPASKYLCFLGAGCANHYIPAVVDEITTRGEFLTCYGAESWADHGKYQTFVEYNSMLAELLETEAMSVPQVDGSQSVATSICMANRINNRRRVLLPETMNPQFKRMVENYLDSNQPDRVIETVYVKSDRATGAIDMADLRAKLDDTITAVFVESINFLGVVEPAVEEIGKLAKAKAAEFIVYVDPISLGVLEAPTRYGATIVCGDLHSLGLHLSCGNGHAGFISTMADEQYMQNYKDFIYSFVEPEVEGEYVFGNVMVDRTHYSRRAKGNEFTGTQSALWMISAAVYMALMGPKGFEEIGETILYNSHYAAKKLAELKEVTLPLSGPFFQEIVVNFDGAGKTVAQINEKLLEKGVFGGLDLTEDFPQLGQSALYCFTEVTGKAEIDQLAAALKEIL